MKNLTFTFIALFFAVSVLAQTPQSFRYQAVARDNSGNVLANQSVSFRISILSGNVSGTEVYKETHTGKTTNAFGLVEMEIGKGTPVSGTFSAINWSNNSYYVKIEMDPSGGSAYQVLSTSQLLSVPYALHAKTAESYNELDGDPQNEIQELSISDNVFLLSKGGGSAELPSSLIPFKSSGGITSNIVLGDNFVFGSTSLDDISGSEDNIRMIFNKSKGAFRAGEAYTTDWDDLNTAQYSVALGYKTRATGYASTSMGSVNTASGMYSTSMGYGTSATSMHSMAIGKYNLGQGNSNSWLPEDPIFEIGIGASNAERANALTVLKNGNVGIGMNPWNDARLSVNSKSMAGLYALNTGTSSIAIGVLSEAIGSGNTQIGIKGYAEHGTQNTGVEGFVSSAGNINFGIYGYADSGNSNFAVYGEVPDGPNNFAGFFDGNGYFDGNLGVGAYPPLSKLDVNGQIRIRGGSPGAGKVLTSDINGLASWQNTAVSPWTLSASNIYYNSGYVGIGTTDVTSPLTIFNPSSSVISMKENDFTNGIKIGSVGGVMTLINDNPTRGFDLFVNTGSGYSVLRVQGSTGNVGIGDLSPDAKLDVAGQVKITGGNPGTGKVLTSDASGLASWQTPVGLTIPYSGAGFSPQSAAEPIFKIENTGFGSAIQGIGSGSPSTIGVYGYSNSPSNGRGVLGYAGANTGEAYGIQGVANSSSGIGVYGYVTALSGITYGVKSYIKSPEGFSGFFDGGKFYISGNAGIGISTPSQKLHIKGSAPGNAVLFIEPNKWNAIGDYGELRLGDANHYIRGEYSKGMTFKDVNQFFFDGGNVGIGTDSPSAKLEISSSDGPQIKITDTTNDGGRPGIQFTGNSSHYISGDDGSNEHFGIYSVWGNSRIYDAKLCVYGKATSSWGKYIGFTHDGTNGLIDTDSGHISLLPGSGRVGIGTTNPAQSLDVVGNTHISGNLGIGTTTPSQKLDVNGNARIRIIASGAYSGPVNRTSDGTLTTATSDVRLKENICSLENSLEKVTQLRGVSFTWKTNPEFGRRIGFIAQEFETVIPELVFTNETDGFKGINYAEISAVLVEAIKELNAENNRLKIKNDQIEAENRQIRTENTKIISRLEKIEALISYSAEK